MYSAENIMGSKLMLSKSKEEPLLKEDRRELTKQTKGSSFKQVSHRNKTKKPFYNYVINELFTN